MNSSSSIFLIIIVLAICGSSASVFLPHDLSRQSRNSGSRVRSLAKRRHRQSDKVILGNMRSSSTAMAIPGYGIAEQVFVGGFGNFLSIFNLVITARILLSWIPQAQSIGALQPLYQITDPYLNLFRGLIPSIGGLDFSPLAAFFLLNVLMNATAAVGCELTPEMKKKLKRNKFGVQQATAVRFGRGKLNLFQ